ncbi:hypothetical protein L3V82_07530 [Thiotrichales bacterium 19S3-7]|nr:hypothetical protein [Thiotrichales bacterium 19S3-7]MCF6802008.1 hypothetical protein [Thiotrichales bacterium 19S3-11]
MPKFQYMINDTISKKGEPIDQIYRFDGYSDNAEYDSDGQADAWTPYHNCWMLASCIATGNNILVTRKYYLLQLLEQGYSESKIIQMEEKGIPLGSEAEVYQKMGMIQQKVEFSSEEVMRLLKTSGGPIVIDRPSQSNGDNLHAEVVIGVENDQFICYGTSEAEIVKRNFSDYSDSNVKVYIPSERLSEFDVQQDKPISPFFEVEDKQSLLEVESSSTSSKPTEKSCYDSCVIL